MKENTIPGHFQRCGFFIKDCHGDTEAQRTKSFLGDFGEEGLGDEAGDGWEYKCTGKAD